MKSIFEKIENRQIRIFISSTFNDLNDERNYLVKNVFPQIKRYCNERDIEFTEVDLRWGITEEQSRSGKVLQTCLQEIDRTSPYFIGILKNRYGWIPGVGELNRNPRIMEEYSWVHDYLQAKRSITDIEFHYGALGFSGLLKKKPFAFFYLGSKNDVSALTKQGIDDIDNSDLARLRKDIMSQKDFLFHHFKSFRLLGKQITKDLTGIIDSAFSIRSDTTPREKLNEEHIRFAQSRQQIYIPNEKYYKLLDAHAAKKSPPLVISGTSGTGKTSLISNWLKRYNKAHRNNFLFFHFTGGATDSTDPNKFLSRLLGELKTEFKIPLNIPKDVEKLRDTLNVFLNQAELRRKKWILVIDGINQMEENPKIIPLNWLPFHFPANVRVIISCLEGDLLKILDSRGYDSLRIERLNRKERKELTIKYLEQYSKGLEANVIDEIAANEKTGNPLILRTLIEELRIFGLHLKLHEHMKKYLETKDAKSFFQLFLTRLEEDYEFEHKGLVSEVLGLIWASRRGLSEDEIKSITGIKPLYWAQFYNAVETHLINKGGLLSYSHNFLREAVEKRYLPGQDDKKSMAEKIANHFEKDKSSQRSLIELPFQYNNAEEWEKLKTYLGDAERFKLLFSMDEIGLISSWKNLRVKFTMGKVYRSSFNMYMKSHKEKEKQLELSKMLGKFLLSAACHDEALWFLRRAMNHSFKLTRTGSSETIEILNDIGEIYYQISDFDSALLYYRKSLKLSKKLKLANQLQAAKSYENIAWIQDLEQHYKRALVNAEKAMSIKKILCPENHREIGETNHILGDIHYGLNEFELAKAMLKEAIRIKINTIGEIHPETAASYSQLAMVHDVVGEFKEALKYYKKDLDISLKIYGEHHNGTSDTYNNLGVFYFNLRKYSRALPFYQKALAIRQEILGEKNEDTAATYNNIGYNYLGQNKLQPSLDNFKKAYKIRLPGYNKGEYDMTETFIGMGLVFLRQGKIKQGNTYLEKGITLANKLYTKYDPEWAKTLEIIGDNLFKIKDLFRAIKYFTKSLKIREHLFKPDHPELIRTKAKIVLF